MEAGFKRGDRILLIDGKAYESYTELLHPQEGTRYTISRKGLEHELIIDKEVAAKIFEANETPFLSVWAPFKISQIIPESPAAYIGLKAGDRIKEINHHAIISLHEFKNTIRLDEDGLIDLLIQREGAAEKILFSGIETQEEGRLGFFSEELLEYSIKQNTLPEAVQKGLARSYNTLSLNIKGFYSLFAGVEVQTKNIGGPIGVAEIFGREYLWQRFWSVTAIFALWISFVNLLPLPNAAFWHMVPLFYEASTKKVFPYPAYQRIKRFGFYALILLMASIMLNDIMQLFG